MAAGHVIVEAVRQVLQGQSHPRGAMVFKNRDRNKLVDHAADNERQMRAEPAVVLGVVAGSSEAHVDEDVRVVTDNVRVPVAPATLPFNFHPKFPSLLPTATPPTPSHNP